MDQSTFKRIARLLKAAYNELEIEALKGGISTSSVDYQKALQTIRESLVAQEGFTIQAYDTAKQNYQTLNTKKKSTLDILSGVAEVLKGEPGQDAPLPTQEELLNLILPNIPKPIPGINGHTPTREELLQIILPLIPKPKDGTTPSREELLKLISSLMPDLRKMLDANTGYLEDKINNVEAKIPVVPPPINTAELKQEIRNEFAANFQRNIDILGMPDFRKLAMGLQGQIDDINRSGSGHTIQDEGTPLTRRTNLNFVGAGVTATDDSANNATVITISTSAGAGFQQPVSGAIDGSNKIFVWAVAPNAISVDGGRIIQKVSSDTTVNWTGTTTTTLAVAPNFDVFGLA